MGLLDGIMGVASEMTLEEVQEKIGGFLCDCEKIHRGYQLTRDFFIFTNKRVIIIDVQGMTGKREEYHSIPYKSISHYAISTAASLDTDAELKIYIGSARDPLIKQFNKKVDIHEVEKTLSEFIIG